MSDAAPNSIHLFDSLGRRLELVVDRFSQGDSSRQLKAKPRTYGDLNLAIAVFSQARGKLVNPENDVQKSIAGFDAENAVNEDGFARDVLDYIELLRLGVVHFVAPLPEQDWHNHSWLSQQSQIADAWNNAFPLEQRNIAAVPRKWWNTLS